MTCRSVFTGDLLWWMFWQKRKKRNLGSHEIMMALLTPQRLHPTSFFDIQQMIFSLLNPHLLYRWAIYTGMCHCYILVLSTMYWMNVTSRYCLAIKMLNANCCLAVRHPQCTYACIANYCVILHVAYRIAAWVSWGKKFVQLEKRWFSWVKISFSLVACTTFR